MYKNNLYRKFVRRYRKTLKQFKFSVNYIAAIMVVLIFMSFCANVIMRYTLGKSFGWIEEVSLILWVWVIFLGAGIFLEDEDHVSLLYMYRAFGRRVSLILKTLSFLIVTVIGILMLSPVWDYIDFLKIRESNVIGIPMNYVFVVYKIFLIALVIKYGYKTILNLYRYYLYYHSHHKHKYIEKH